MAKKTFLNVNGTFKEIIKIYRCIEHNVWQDGVIVWYNYGGTWKQCWEYIASNISCNPTTMNIASTYGNAYFYITSDTSWTCSNSENYTQSISGGNAGTNIEVVVYYPENFEFAWSFTAINTVDEVSAGCIIWQGF